jgi:DNA-binding response OmpR family regulator
MAVSTPFRSGRFVRRELSRVLPQTSGQLRVLAIGDVELEIDGHNLRVRGEYVHVPHKEFVILHLLMDNAGRVVTRRQILDVAWGKERRDDRKALEGHIARLRRRIEVGHSAAPRIRTVRGVGYVYELPAGGRPGDSPIQAKEEG